MKMILDFILDQWKVTENVQSVDGMIIFLFYNDNSGCFVENGIKRVDGEKQNTVYGRSWGENQLLLKLLSGKRMGINGGIKKPIEE